MTDAAEALVGQLRSELTSSGGDHDRADGAIALQLTGTPTGLASCLPVADAALACVATALVAAGRLYGARAVSVDRGHVSAAVISERLFRPGAGAGFASLSRFWRTSDGWLRTHANYPWHRSALLAALGVPDAGDATAVPLVEAALAARTGRDAEDAVFGAGGVAARVQSSAEWMAGAPGVALTSEPLIGHAVRGAGSPRRGDRLRVLDLTRVIAGPVCTRMLGALGADVLRVDPPHRSDGELGQPGDTLLGKRTSVLDLGTNADEVHRLLEGADVLVTGYRPGSLDRFGLDDQTLAERHPGLVVVRLAAWGHTGPWQQRRGFDSIVQAASGIAMLEGDGDRPGALPCQLLDHGTGYLAAAAAWDSIRRQRAEGGTHVRALSLARTAHWLLGLSRDDEAAGERPTAVPDDWLIEVDTGAGRVHAVAPPGALDGTGLRWPAGLGGYGDADPVWS